MHRQSDVVDTGIHTGARGAPAGGVTAVSDAMNTAPGRN
jgi:dihydroorotase-like cyclic amidohydrolase